MNGRVVHFEIPFDDGDRARSFYKEVFGWQVQELPEMSYTMVTSGPSADTGPSEPGFINGGMLARDDGAARSPVVVIEVDDIDETLIKIEDVRGRSAIVAPKTPVGEMGFAAYVKDSEDNVIGLWQTAPQG